MTYTPPQFNNINVDLESGYVAPAFNSINVDLAVGVSTEPETPIDTTIEAGLPKMRPDIGILWGDSKEADKKYTIRFKDANNINLHKRVVWVQTVGPADKIISVKWGDLPEIEKKWRLKYARFTNLIDNKVASPFTAIKPQKDRDRTLLHGDLAGKDKEKTLPWGNPPPLEAKKRLVWNDFDKPVDVETDFKWISGVPVDLDHNTKWGKKFYNEICVREYEPPPGGAVNFNIETPIEDVDDGAFIRFYFDSLTYDKRCSHREPSGFRDRYDYTPPEDYARAQNNKVYTIMNNFFMTRVVDGKPIDVRTATITGDFGSWCWTFTADILSNTSFNDLDPDENGAQEVEIEINGYKWRFLVEGATDNESFSRPTWIVTGRGLAAELADPYAGKSSYTETATRTAIQLIDERLTDTGWTAEYLGVDWLVDAGAYSYQDFTPLKAIQQVAESSGAVLMSDRIDKKLIIISRYKNSPWSMDAATPDLSINRSVVTSSGMTWNPGPSYNAVFVSGTNTGVLVKVSREGSAGDLLSPMVTDPLITAIEAGRERGRVELAKSGSWKNGSFTMPLFPSPGVPGLVTPGNIVEIADKTKTYKTQAISNTITADRRNGLVVRQSVGVEKYCD